MWQGNLKVAFGSVIFQFVWLEFQVIDKNGPPPKGTGIKQLRENIAESKLSYEIMDDAAQVIIQLFEKPILWTWNT